MGKLIILKLDDGDLFAESMKREFQSFCGTVEVKSLYEFNTCDDHDGQVHLVIISSLVCRELNRFPEETWKRLLVSQRDRTVVLMTCKVKGETLFTELCQKIGAATPELHIFNYYRDKAEWYKVESQLKIMLSHGKSSNVPRERTFILKPSTILQNDVEVVVVLFEDHPDAVTLSAKLSSGPGLPTEIRNLKKVRDDVWTINTRDLKAKKYTVQILVDSTDIGEAVLTVRDDLETLIDTLDRTMRKYPRDLLSRLFQLELDRFDEELADMLRNSASFIMTKLFDGLMKPGNNEMKDPTTFEGFLDKYGCTRTKKAMDYSHPRTRSKLQEVQASDSDDEHAVGNTRKQTKLEQTTSPLSTSIKYPHQFSATMGRPRNLSDGIIERKHYGRDTAKGYSFSDKKKNGRDSIRDSGFSTGSSTGNDSRGEVRPCTRRDRIVSDGEVKGYDFNGGRQHPYDTIDEPTQGHILRSPRDNPYDKPWEDNPLPQGTMPQKQPDEHFSESTTL